MTSDTARAPRYRERRRRSLLGRNALYWLLALPAVLVAAGVSVYPFGYSFLVGLHDVNVISGKWTYIGLENYSETLGGSEFWSAAARTAYFTALCVVLSSVLGLAAAIVLNERFIGRAFVRTVAVLPWAAAGVVVGYLWSFMFNAQHGFVNAALGAIGLDSLARAWMADGTTALVVVAIAYIWHTTPMAMLLFLAGLQSVPDSLRRAARVDGARARQVFVNVIWPYLRPTALLILVLSTINALLAFDFFWVMTQGGPGRSTTVLAWLGYEQAFRFFQLGKGTATLYVLSLASLLLAVAYFLVLRTRRLSRRPKSSGQPIGQSGSAPVRPSPATVRELDLDPRGGKAFAKSGSRRAATTKRRFKVLSLNVAGWILAAWTLVPLLVLVTYSLSTAVQITQNPLRILPTAGTLRNYCTIFFGEVACRTGGGSGGLTASGIVPQGLWNSAVVSLSTALLAVAIGALAGYAFSRNRTSKALEASMWVTLLTRMVPSLAVVIPFFIIFRQTGLLDSRWALIITYSSVLVPITLWVMRSYFATIPTSLDYAAMSDGCTRLGAYVRVVLPVAAPGLAASFLFCFLVAWNEFIFAVTLTGENSQTIPVVIAGYSTQIQNSQLGAMFAAGVVAILPTIVLALVGQRHLVRGLTSGSVR
ncbi:MAG: ABC transporter permease subunit [Actinobacteria bacterium]|nr:ABC transporter permease subunit [Actinomycetota bacterium]